MKRSCPPQTPKFPPGNSLSERFGSLLHVVLHWCPTVSSPSFLAVYLLRKGYLNSVVGIVNTLLGKIYPTTYVNSTYSKNITSIVFAGTVVGMLVFGYFSDKLGRKFGMVSATIIVVVFSILSAGAYGAVASTDGMLAALAAYRFFLRDWHWCWVSGRKRCRQWRHQRNKERSPPCTICYGYQLCYWSWLGLRWVLATYSSGFIVHWVT